MDVIGSLLLILREDIEDELREAALIGASLGQDRHVGRVGAAIGRARRLLIGERRREAVGGAARPVEHLALLVGAVLDLIGRGQRGDLALRELWPARLGEIAKGDQARCVAGRADLLVDLIAALQLGAVEFAERPGEGPAHARRIDAAFGCLRRGRGQREREARSEACQGQTKR